MTITAIASPAPVRVGDAGAEVTGEADRPAGLPDQPARVRAMLAQEQALEEQTQANLLLQRQRFDFAAEERSELMREQDAMRDLMMAQLKGEDAYMKKWIEMI